MPLVVCRLMLPGARLVSVNDNAGQRLLLRGGVRAYYVVAADPTDVKVTVALGCSISKRI
jgi:hypothetical protein